MMADRQFQVLHDGHGTFPLLIAGVSLLAPDGAAAILTASEARRLRDALNAAIDVHNRECGLAQARIRLDRLNGVAQSFGAKESVAFFEALDRSSLIVDAPGATTAEVVDKEKSRRETWESLPRQPVENGVDDAGR